MNEMPTIIGVDFGRKDSTVLGAVTRSGCKLVYTLAEGESCMATERGFIITHPDRPPRLVTSDGIEEIET